VREGGKDSRHAIEECEAAATLSKRSKRNGNLHYSRGGTKVLIYYAESDTLNEAAL
jgi:hypothetical protein